MGRHKGCVLELLPSRLTKSSGRWYVVRAFRTIIRRILEGDLQKPDFRLTAALGSRTFIIVQTFLEEAEDSESDIIKL